MLLAQGADLSAFKKKLSANSTAPVVAELKSTRAGVVTHCDARALGEVIRDLGGGRATKDSAINHDVGIDNLRKPGDHVLKGAILARVHSASKSQVREAIVRVQSAFQFRDS